MSTGTELATTQTEGGALAPRASVEAIQELEKVAAHCRVIQANVATEFEKTFALAAAKRRLSELITDDMMQDIMMLQGSPIGFTTDLQSDGKNYPIEVVKEVAIEATLRGLRMYGNEITIISGRLYGGQSGMRRLVTEFPGVSDVRIDMREPIMRAAYALVPCVASYCLDGVTHTVDCLGPRAIPVRVNKGMIIDAILGKAKRKLFSRIYDCLTGLEHGLVEADDEITVESTATADTLPDEYATIIEDATTVSDVTEVAKAIGANSTLSKAAKQQGTQLCNERVKAIRSGRGERLNGGDGRLLNTAGSATAEGM